SSNRSLLSTLLTARKTGFVVRRRTSDIASSNVVMPAAESTIKISAWASSKAISTCFLISRSKTSSLSATNPPVSIRLKVLPTHSATPYCRSRVTPLMSSTIALRCSSSRLKKVLFPTFGRPTMATVNPLIISVISVFFQKYFRIPPFRSHLDEQFKEHFPVNKSFNILARGGAQGPDHLPALSEDDPFLRFALHDDIRPDLGQAALLREFLHQYRRLVGYLVFVQQENLFPDHLAHKEFGRKVGKVVSFKKRLALGQQA